MPVEVILLAAARLTPGSTSIIVTLIVALGGILVAFVQVYRRAGDIQVKVDGQLTAALQKLDLARVREQELAIENAVLKERLKHVDAPNEDEGRGDTAS